MRSSRRHMLLLKRFLDDEASEESDTGHGDGKGGGNNNKKKIDNDNDDDDDVSSEESSDVSELMADIEEEIALKDRLLEDSEKLADFHAHWEMRRDEALIKAVEEGKLFTKKGSRTRGEAAAEDEAEKDVAQELDRLHHEEENCDDDDDDDDLDSMDLGSDLVVSEDDIISEEGSDGGDGGTLRDDIKSISSTKVIMERLKEARREERLKKMKEVERRKKTMKEVKSQLESGLSTLEDREQEQYIKYYYFKEFHRPS
ncbi:FK506-binding protein, putative [Perkinsus marinus ATCC 50983]|uniref:FK506-binding protein, putative n=1 Tax=Perkinsus marinus (strain ATCC 50983 / TXsc) TaxID=423536 RepID=C5LL00_PERM5|nr:FK506-binding protein, putative [Perkinsus marinus ATCC 50983]EER02564.1 FK506-binding protein, putative [Perkinsus marinus ATCC 50983]|eukprot:XP_002769846.1 FK506-binding protein, putative [Perkinsus marinus ATCC 50983]